MDLLAILLHVLSFAAPAFAVALLVTLGARLVMPRPAQGPGWWGRFAITFAAGLVASGVGLWYFGHDGKMATYALLVLVAATAQWVTGRGWRG